jgi:hypothetical protein
MALTPKNDPKVEPKTPPYRDAVTERPHFEGAKAATKAVVQPTVEAADIPANEPYPTGDPKGPQTWAEINGLVPIGTGPLAPATPPAK